jgi:hypothetical protein
VLLFELFPLFMALLSVLVGLWLVMADRAARQDPTERMPRKVPPPRPPGDRDKGRGGRRPSMSA